MNWLPALLGLTLGHALAQDGRIPPERVDPTPMPVPVATYPVQPTDGRRAEEQQRSSPTAEQDAPPQRTAARRAPAPASIFTDEEYRCIRVRALLVRAMEGRL